MTEAETVRLDVSEGIAVVTLDRPPVNAQNAGIRERLIEVFDELSDRDDVRVVILAAAGKVFSAGADIKERGDVAAKVGAYRRNNRITREFFYAVRDCEKPVIAAVNGAALGAGCVLALSCDIILVSDTAYFAMPELDVGLAGGAKFLSEHFGRSMAREIYFTSRRVPAEELMQRGIVSACVPGDQLLPRAMDIARAIAAKSPVAVRLVKRAFGTVEAMPTRDAYRFEQTVTVELSKTEDTKEAQRAFVEKRKPVFKGR